MVPSLELFLSLLSHDETFFCFVLFYLLLTFGKEKGYNHVEFTRQRPEIFFYGFIFVPSLSF